MTATIAETHHLSCYAHRTYYLTCDDYDELWQFARGRCQICDTPAEETKRGSLCIDHDGYYGFQAVRGLLCDKCNSLMARVDARKIASPSSEVYRYRYNAWFARRVMWDRGFVVHPDLRRWEWPGTKMNQQAREIRARRKVAS